VPEARLESAPYSAFYAYGKAGAFGFSPFGIESQQSTSHASGSGPTIKEVYEVLDSISDVLLSHQASEGTRGVVLHGNSPRATQTVARIESIEEVSRSSGNWNTQRQLNGDQTNQGRRLLMAAHQVRVYRVLLYATPRNA